MKGLKVWVLGLLLFVALIIAACGGGNGSGSPSSSPAPVPNKIKPIGMYFGICDNQIQETADHVQMVMPLDWGDWDRDQVYIQQRILDQIQQAKTHGLKSVVAIGFLTWDKKGNSKGTQYLEVFKTQLEALGLMDSIEAWYPIDEPDVQIKAGKITEAQIIDGIQRIHSVFPDIQFMTIYGDSGGYPALQWFDYTGKDKYETGGPVDPPGPGGIIVAGGADPWKEDPEKFYEYAMTHPVKYIVYFLYCDYDNGKQGIRNNGMLPAYKAVGQKLKGQ